MVTNELSEANGAMEAGKQAAAKLFGDAGDWYYNPDTKEFENAEGVDLGFAFYPRDSRFQTSTGYDLKLNRYNVQLLVAWKQTYRKKYEPTIPKRAIEYETGKFFLEGNPKDPSYEQELDRFNENFGFSALCVQVSLSVANATPTPENMPDSFTFYIENILELDRALSPYEEKFVWLMTLMPSNAEMFAFLHVIQGQDLPSREDIAEAESRF